MTDNEQISLLKNIIEYLYNAIGDGEDFFDALAYMPISSKQAEELGLHYMVHDLKSKGK